MADKELINDPDEFTRDELNDIAGREGVADAEKLPNKAAVVEAINARRAASANVGSADAESVGAGGGGVSGTTGTGDAPTRPNMTATVVVPPRPTAASVFGAEQAPVGALAFDTSAFQPPEGEQPVYGDARTRKLVNPDGKVRDDGSNVNKPDDNRDQ